MKAIPVGMGQLRGNCTPNRRTRGFGKSVKNFFGSHDPEHIKATKGIKGVQSLAGNRWLCHKSFFAGETGQANGSNGTYYSK
jgi:hypothetical protein